MRRSVLRLSRFGRRYDRGSARDRSISCGGAFASVAVEAVLSLALDMPNSMFEPLESSYLEVLWKLLPSLVARIHSDEVCHVPLQTDDLTVARKHEMLRTDTLRIRYSKNL